MKTRLLLGLIASLAAVSAVTVACNSEHGDDFGTPAGSPTPVPTTFTAAFLTYVQGGGGCAGGGCHAATSPANNLTLAGAGATVYASVIAGGTYEQTMAGAVADINTTNAAGSLVLSLCVNSAGNTSLSHPVHPFANSADPNYQAILHWIEGGAPNN